MNIEGWMISLIIALIGVVSTFAVTKNKVENNDKQIEDYYKSFTAPKEDKAK